MLWGNVPITSAPPRAERGTPIKPTVAPMPNVPPPKQESIVNPFEPRPITLTVMEWRYIIHTLRLCKVQYDAAEEILMNEHCRDVIEKAANG